MIFKKLMFFITISLSLIIGVDSAFASGENPSSLKAISRQKSRFPAEVNQTHIDEFSQELDTLNTWVQTLQLKDARKINSRLRELDRKTEQRWQDPAYPKSYVENWRDLGLALKILLDLDVDPSKGQLTTDSCEVKKTELSTQDQSLANQSAKARELLQNIAQFINNNCPL